jgi:hypothetical protein
MRLHLSVRIHVGGRQRLVSAFKRIPERIELDLRHCHERAVFQLPQAAQVAHKPRVSPKRGCSFGGSGDEQSQESNAGASSFLNIPRSSSFLRDELEDLREQLLVDLCDQVRVDLDDANLVILIGRVVIIFCGFGLQLTEALVNIRRLPRVLLLDLGLDLAIVGREPIVERWRRQHAESRAIEYASAFELGVSA